MNFRTTKQIDCLIELVEARYRTKDNQRLRASRDEEMPRQNFVNALRWLSTAAQRTDELNRNYGPGFFVDTANMWLRRYSFGPTNWRALVVAAIASDVGHSDPAEFPFVDLAINPHGSARTPSDAWFTVLQRGATARPIDKRSGLTPLRAPSTIRHAGR